MASSDSPKNIVVIGGGIIGSTSAYFLSHHPSFDRNRDSITLLESTKIAGGASGKAGGLLALWAYPSSIVPLSYKLHKELADKHGGTKRWGYRGVNCGQIEMKGRSVDPKAMDGKNSNGDIDAAKAPLGGTGKESDTRVSLKKRTKEALGLLRRAGVPEDLDWVIPENVRAYEEMGDPSTTAQVHPYQFTTSMASLAEEAGVKIVYGSATSIDKSADGSAVKSVTYSPKAPDTPNDSNATANPSSGETKVLPATHVVLSAGPWTPTILPGAPISALRAHSVTIKADVSPYCLFTSITLPASTGKTGESRRKQRQSTQTVTPEIYARPNNEIYACGEGDHLIPLPKSTDLVQVDESRCQDIVDYVSAISDELRDGEVTARQACYLPNVSRGSSGPIIGETSVKGLLVATGHTCWGIQNGPGTGKLVSEIVWDGKAKSAAIGALDPKRWGL
ncbi:hypothetical protein H2201_004475 [Coniosporium apollinis]|uniref:FAD dependent oxidoreductase domain-containing protein n=2 Tax=Coniosporium TaxID=2810619 RepID=A0ABQ9NTE4_9PEZI|nr:hypothetical protein H2199_005154 [Cladosporium sp. JES 115]KAJ9665397.1 hypothetical protein H2201_004475 [Coniosporium apollinis]